MRRGVLAIAVLALASCGGGDEELAGVEPGSAPRAEQREESDRPREPVLLATTELADGRRVLLQTRHDAGGACLTLIGLDEYIRQCGRAPSERDPSSAHKPLAPGPIAQIRPSAPFEVYGETSPDVTAVVLQYASKGFVTKTPAELLRVTNERVLAAAGIRKPFGYYFQELPPDASNVRVAAFGRDGRQVGTGNYRAYRGLHRRVFIANCC